MKKIVIIRHAKAEDQNSSLDDYDRTLTKRGIEDATFIGNFLNNKGLIPDLITSSPSTRTMETSEIIAKEVSYDKAIIPNQYIYEAYVTMLQEIISFIHDDNEIVFLVGHNPGVSTLAYMLCELKESIPSSAVVEIDFNCDSWLEVSRENSTLISYDFPKKLQ